MLPKIIPCISRAISAQDEAGGLPSASGVANPEKADYSAAASSPVPSWAPHGVFAALSCCTKSNAQTPAWGRTLRAPPEGDHHGPATGFLAPLGALVIYAVVYDLRRRRRHDDPRSHDISTAARLARTNTDAHGVSGLGQGTNVGGVGGGGAPGT